MFSSIKNYLEDLDKICKPIEDERKSKLDQLAKIINQSSSKDLIFICTHNSRRSHFAQIWMHIISEYLGHNKKVKSYSGGTEATALNPRTAQALSRIGFEIQVSAGANPLFQIRYDKVLSPIEAFSKVYSHPSNPQSDFIAIMTCNEASEACPIVTGAAIKFNLSYKDPKTADDSTMEVASYDASCAEIAQEILYLGSRIQWAKLTWIRCKIWGYDF